MRGVRPDDNSDTAAQARRIENFGELNGMRFMARLGIQPANNSYAAQNRIAEVITPDRKNYQRVEQPAKSASPSPLATAKSASTPAQIERPGWAS